MFDIAWSELLIIAALAILVVGPKDLPRVMRAVGQWTSRARATAREFRNSLDEVVREAELDEFRKKAAAARRAADPSRTIEAMINADETGKDRKPDQ